MSRWHRLLALLPVVLMAACAQLRPMAPVDAGHQAEAPDFRIDGRLAVKATGKGHYGNFDWKRVAGVDDVAVMSPLGQIVATLNRQRDAVCLVAHQRERCAADTEQLTEAELGWPLPLDNLGWWILGRPAPGAWQQDGAGFVQDGWRIIAESPVDTPAGPRPTRVTLTRGSDLEIRFAINGWQ